MENKPMLRVQPFTDTEPATLPMPLEAEAETGDFDTVPLPLAHIGPASRRQPQGEPELDDVLVEIRRNNRVCPQPTRWLEFFRVLERAADGTRLPEPPLTGSAWAATPSLSKRMCLRHQVEWASAHGCLQDAWKFLQGLRETDWHYMG